MSSTKPLSYESLLKTYIHPKEQKIANSSSRCLASTQHALFIPASLGAAVSDTAIGVIAGLATIVTVGKHQKTYNFAIYHLESTKFIIAKPCKNLIKTLNPKAKFSDDKDKSHSRGLLARIPIEKLNNFANRCRDSKSFFARHVGTRLTYTLLAIVCIVTRIVDVIFGSIALLFSLLTLGKFKLCNDVAFQGLQITGLVSDLFYCMIKVINPWAGVEKRI